MAGSVDDLFGFKVTISSLNALFGSYFIYLYIRFFKKANLKQEKKSELKIFL